MFSLSIFSNHNYLITSQKWRINKNCYCSHLKETIFHDDIISIQILLRYYLITYTVQMFLILLGNWNSVWELLSATNRMGTSHISEALNVYMILAKMNMWVEKFRIWTKAFSDITWKYHYISLEGKFTFFLKVDNISVISRDNITFKDK